MDLGFKQAGFDIIWANDFNIDAVNTYKRNIGNHIVLGDITQISSSEIAKNYKNIDVIIGGFPCQGFSIANTKRNMEDKRNFLYLEMLRIIKDKQPKFFVAENVKGLASTENGKVLKMIIKDFETLCYLVDWKIINAAQHGVPQQRERIIIIGNRIGVKNIFPKQTHADIFPGEDNYNKPNIKLLNKGLKPYITVEQTIKHLQNVNVSQDKKESFVLVNNKKIYNHIALISVKDKFFGRKYNVNQADVCDYLKYWRDLKSLTTKQIDEHFGYKHTAGHWFRKDNNSGSIPKPSDWWELKRLLKFDDKYDKLVTTFIEKPIQFDQSLRITNWNRPSDTITATSPEIHINKQRRLSVRECALIQTFPNDFIFEGNINSQYRQVGNAVPVQLAEKIAKEILRQLGDFYKNKKI